MARQLFELVYSPVTRDHLAAIDRRYHRLIREHIEGQLNCEPEVNSRNRKPLQRPVDFGAEWEIRFGPDNRFRVFYRVEKNAVIIQAIGVKEGNRLTIGGREVIL